MLLSLMTLSLPSNLEQNINGGLIAWKEKQAKHEEEIHGPLLCNNKAQFKLLYPVVV